MCVIFVETSEFLFWITLECGGAEGFCYLFHLLKFWKASVISVYLYILMKMKIALMTILYWEPNSKSIGQATGIQVTVLGHTTHCSHIYSISGACFQLSLSTHTLHASLGMDAVPLCIHRWSSLILKWFEFCFWIRFLKSFILIKKQTWCNQSWKYSWSTKHLFVLQ